MKEKEEINLIGRLRSSNDPRSSQSEQILWCYKSSRGQAGQNCLAALIMDVILLFASSSYYVVQNEERNFNSLLLSEFQGPLQLSLYMQRIVSFCFLLSCFDTEETLAISCI